MPVRTEAPLIVQSDRTLFLEVDHPLFEEVRDRLLPFAELVKSPEHIHTYRITAISLWNAAALNLKAEDVITVLKEFSRFDLPQNILVEIEEAFARYGIVKLIREPSGEAFSLLIKDPIVQREVLSSRAVQPFLVEGKYNGHIPIQPNSRGHVKQALIKLGYPVEDLAGYDEGSPLGIQFRKKTVNGTSFQLRPYQSEAIASFWGGGTAAGGAGVVVLPCGAGKTIVGLGAMERAQTETLILATNITALRQWISEILDKTSIKPDEIGEYSGEKKDIRPVTVTTYQILTHRKAKGEHFPHFDIFSKKNWGLILYDEVHLLPAPVFRITAEIQAKRRLGLTATLVREDGREDEVFSLIGPKRYDVPWKELEKKGYIAAAECREVRVPLPPDLRLEYASAGLRSKFRLASENAAKDRVVEEVVRYHKGDSILVIGQYLDQLRRLAKNLQAPLITGQTPNREREELYDRFREKKIPLLVVSKVANFAVDLPEANVAIQVSGTFGSRQEEAQRLGRILRPKADGTKAFFYSVVSKDSKDQEFSAKRQLFLTEQGYRYVIYQDTEVVKALLSTCHSS